MKCYGLHKGFCQFGISIGNTHDYWQPPAPAVKFVPGFVEGPAFMGWWGGIPLTHKVATTVRFDGGDAVQQGHDAGYLIPHIPPLAAVPNLMLIVHMATSKHKVMFPATHVLVQKKPMGMYAGRFLGAICSNPITLPTGFLIKLSGTVVHDMALEDLIMGMALLLVDMVIDILWSKIMKGDIWRGANRALTSKAIRKASYIWRLTGKLKDRVPALRNLAAKLAGTKVARTPWWKGKLNKIFNDKMTGPKASLVWKNVKSKWADHAFKSWAVSPVLSGLIFQGVEPWTGIPRNALPSIAVGRSGAHISFFSNGQIISFHQNVNN